MVPHARAFEHARLIGRETLIAQVASGYRSDERLEAWRSYRAARTEFLFTIRHLNLDANLR